MTRMLVGERRTRLIDAAIAVMCRDGVAKTTTRSIVAEAGMPIGVFHYCFRSKDELVLEVMRTLTNRSFAAVGEVLSQTAEPEELIHLATRAYWQHIQSNPLEHQITYELTQYALRHPSNAHAASAQYQAYVSGMEEFLAAVALAGDFRWATPEEVLARFVLAMVEGVTLQWLVDKDDAMALRLLDELVRHLHADIDEDVSARRP